MKRLAGALVAGDHRPGPALQLVHEGEDADIGKQAPADGSDGRRRLGLAEEVAPRALRDKGLAGQQPFKRRRHATS